MTNVQGSGAQKKWTPSDKPLTPKEAYGLFKEGKLNMTWAQATITEEEFCAEFLYRSPVTPAALRTLEEQGFRWKPENLRKWLITRARETGKQLDNAAAQERKVAFFASEQKQRVDYQNLIDLKPDESSPNKDGEICFLCKVEFKPMSLFLCEGQRVISTITNEPVRIGNYKFAKVNGAGEADPENGKQTIIPVCKTCGGAAGAESYTYESATKAVEAADAEKQAEQDHAKKVALLRKALCRPDGSPRYNSGDARTDLDAVSQELAARRSKGSFKGSRRHK